MAIQENPYDTVSYLKRTTAIELYKKIALIKINQLEKEIDNGIKQDLEVEIYELINTILDI